MPEGRKPSEKPPLKIITPHFKKAPSNKIKLFFPKKQFFYGNKGRFEKKLRRTK